MAQAVAWIPYCGAAPVPAEWLARWNWDPWVLAGLGVVAVLFSPPFRGRGWGWVSGAAARCRGAASWLGSGKVFAGIDPAQPLPTPSPSLEREGKSRGRLLFAAAWLLLFTLFVSPFCALTSALFSARVVHHVGLVAVVAPLLAWGFPAGRRIGLWPATAVQAVIFWVWHAPPAYAWALSSHAGYWLMQASLLASAVAFWAAVRRASAPAAAGALLATMVQMGLLGALITFAGRPLYAPHLASTLAWGFSPLEDQQLAGLIMWAPAAALYLGAALLLLGRWIGPDRPRMQPE